MDRNEKKQSKFVKVVSEHFPVNRKRGGGILNAHNFHHKHYKGEISEVSDFTNYQELVERFEKEIKEFIK